MKNSIGVIYQLSDVLQYGADKLEELGIDCVQIQCFRPELLTEENADAVKKALNGKIRISSFWAGWTGPKIWDFIDGPHTLGLVPVAYRFERLNQLICGCDFAEMIGVSDMATHVGFLPENPSSVEYREVYAAVKRIADYCSSKNIHFNFETGQETPITLMRMVNDLDNDMVGINFDPANLILYGKGNPIDAIDIFGNRIRGVHIKDGDYPTDFYKLGEEKVVGEGSVNFPVFIKKLLDKGYEGDFYIEREISGEQQTIDIKKTITYINNLLEETSK